MSETSSLCGMASPQSPLPQRPFGKPGFSTLCGPSGLRTRELGDQKEAELISPGSFATPVG